MSHSADITPTRAFQPVPVAGRLAIVAALVALSGFMGCVRPSRAQMGDGDGERGAAAGAGSPAPTAHDAAPSGDAVQAKPAPKRAPNIRLTFRTVPPKKATVMWGKKRLGIIDPKTPLVVQRPRDSGPLDVVVRAENCLPVHTRAYTFTDSTMAVKVTPIDQKNTVYGYREELPPEGEDGASLDISGAGGGTSGAAPPAGFPSR